VIILKFIIWKEFLCTLNKEAGLNIIHVLEHTKLAHL